LVVGQYTFKSLQVEYLLYLRGGCLEAVSNMVLMLVNLEPHEIQEIIWE